MNIRIISPYRVDKKFIKKGMEEYTKRLTRYCKISFLRIKSPGDILKAIKDRETVIRVDVQGESISSEDLAEYIGYLGVTGKSDVLFIAASKETPIFKEDRHISLSSMEMDGQLLTLTLYEQIYRAFAIINKLPYHK